MAGSSKKQHHSRKYENEYLGYIKVARSTDPLLSLKQRQRLLGVVDHVLTQCVVLVLVLLDLHVITALLLIQQGIIHDPSGGNQTVIEDSVEISHNILVAREVLHCVHIALLSVFLAEILIRIVCYGRDVTHDKLVLLDGLLTLTVLICYVTLTAAATDTLVAYALSYIVAFRLWRTHRLYRTLTRRVKQKAERMILVHRQAWKLEQEQLKHAQEKIHSQQRELASLREHLRVLELNTRYLASSMQSLPTEQHKQQEFSEEETSDYQLTAVTVEKDYTPNGSLPPSWTPKGSMGSVALVTSSSPGTPRSTCSNVSLLPGTAESTSTERLAGAASPTKYPDVVEDAQSADSREFESPCASPKRQRRAPYQGDCGTGNTSSDAANLETKPDTHLGTELELARQSETHGESELETELGRESETQLDADTEDTGGRDSGIQSIETNSSQSQRVQADQLHDHGASQGQNPSDIQVKVAEAGSTVQENNHTTKESGQFGFTNAAYDAEDGEDEVEEEQESIEELHEIRRVSQVPFHPDTDTYLNKEGIPMTDL